jgi:acyl carrier protein
MDMSAFQKIRQAVATETGEEVTPDTRLVSLVTDSLEMANLILELEGALGIEIPDEDAQKLYLVRDVVAYAEAH